MLLSIPFTISACFPQPVDKFYCSSVGSNPATAMVKMGGTYQYIKNTNHREELYQSWEYFYMPNTTNASLPN